MADWLTDNWDEIICMQPVKAKPKMCGVTGCPREHRGRGLCSTHYMLARIEHDPAFGARYRELRRRSGERKMARLVAEREAEQQAEIDSQDQP